MATKTEGGNAVFTNYNNQFAHIKVRRHLTSGMGWILAGWDGIVIILQQGADF